MPFYTPITWTVGQVVTKENLDQQIRDNINAIRDEDVVFASSVPSFYGNGVLLADELASPSPIGSVTPSTGSFTTLDTTGDASFGDDVTIDATLSVAGTSSFTGEITANAEINSESSIDLKGISTPSTPASTRTKLFLSTGEHLYALRSDGLTYPLGPSLFWFAKAQKSTTQSINSGTSTILTFDQEVYDSFTMHDNVTNNSRITVPRAGFYEILAEVTFAANATGQRGYIVLKNAAEVGRQIVGASTSTSVTVAGSHMVYASANEYFELQGFQNSGGALNVSNSPQTYFTVRWIGA